MKHASDTDLALFASGDLPWLASMTTSLHVRSCRDCRFLVDEFRASSERLKADVSRLPASLDEGSAEWRRLSAEMTANIHLGLEAGECVAPFESRSRSSRFQGQESVWTWRPALAGAAIAASLMLVVGSAWWLNVPASDVAILQRAFGRMVGREAIAAQERGPLVEASSKGIAFHETVGSLGMKVSGSTPVAVSVSFEGSASAHYVDADSGQVTVNTVYAQ